METWAWLAAYVLGFALLQLYLYRYFIEGQSTSESTPESTTPQLDGGATIEQAENGEAIDHSGDHVACTQCGGYNENE